MAQTVETTSPKKKGLKIVIIILSLLVLLIIGVGIGVFFFSGSEEDGLLSSFTQEAEAAEIAIPLDEFLINLSSDSATGQPIVRMELTVTSKNEEATEIVTAEIAKVRDAVIHVVSNQSVGSIYEESEGQFLVKEQIKNRINSALGEDIVEDVFLTNILIQK